MFIDNQKFALLHKIVSLTLSFASSIKWLNPLHFILQGY